MWSEKYIARFGIVKDSYHRSYVFSYWRQYHRTHIYFMFSRIVQKMDIMDLLDQNWYSMLSEYVSGYHLRHLLIGWDISTSLPPSDIAEIHSNLTALRDMTLPEEKIVYTLEIINYADNASEIETLLQTIQPSVLILRRLGSREVTLGAIETLSVLLSSFGSNSIALGISGVPSSEIQYYMNSTRGLISLVCLGNQQYPMIEVHAAEIAHSQGCNTMLTISETSSSAFHGLDKYSKKYDHPNTAILIKAILQMGTIVAFPKGTDPRFMRDYALRLCHPFTYTLVITIRNTLVDCITFA